jgi:hypothetical protein
MLLKRLIVSHRIQRTVISKMSEKQPRYLSPEEAAYEEQRNLENEQKKAQIEAAKQSFRKLREQKDKELAAKIMADRLASEQRQKAQLESFTVGFDNQQKKDWERLYVIESKLNSIPDGDEKDALLAEYGVLLANIQNKGRLLGEAQFIQEYIYISVSGNGLIFRGQYHNGVVGAYDTTDQSLQYDKESDTYYLVMPSHIENSNIDILNKLKVVIVDKVPDQQELRTLTKRIFPEGYGKEQRDADEKKVKKL